MSDFHQGTDRVKNKMTWIRVCKYVCKREKKKEKKKITRKIRSMYIFPSWGFHFVNLMYEYLYTFCRGSSPTAPRPPRAIPWAGSMDNFLVPLYAMVKFFYFFFYFGLVIIASSEKREEACYPYFDKTSVRKWGLSERSVFWCGGEKAQVLGWTAQTMWKEWRYQVKRWCVPW